MKKFKDFLYDKNDILIALLILIVAALIITWRMNAIMEYPSTILNSSVSGEDQSSGDSGQSGEAAGTDGDGGTADGSSTDDGSASAGSGDTSGGDESSSAGTEALWANGALTRDVPVSYTHLDVYKRQDQEGLYPLHKGASAPVPPNSRYLLLPHRIRSH